MHKKTASIQLRITVSSFVAPFAPDTTEGKGYLLKSLKPAFLHPKTDRRGLD